MTTGQSLSSRRGDLAAQDRRAARLAELYYIRALAGDAADVVRAGWTQATYFVTVDERGRRHVVDPQRTRERGVATFDRACLVGAIVHAAGGPAAVGSQLVERTLDLTWHTLYRGPDQPIRLCPPPQVRVAQVRDLTRWNDTAGRTLADVLALLHATRAAAEAEARRLRPVTAAYR
jgi:hypothetical protein